jgi:hypothetical protein
MNNFLKWTATAITLIGAILTSMNLHPFNIYAFNIGCLFWILWGIRIKELSVVLVNTGLLLIYLIGALV